MIKFDHSKKNEVYVHYTYWDSKFDEWRPNDHDNIASLHTHTFIDGGVLKVGQRVEVLDQRMQWLEAFVIEEKDNEVSCVRTMKQVVIRINTILVSVHVEMMMMMMMLVEAKMMNIDFALFSCITRDCRYVSSTHPQLTFINHHRPIGEGPL